MSRSFGLALVTAAFLSTLALEGCSTGGGASGGGMASSLTKSLYERLGGEAAIKAVVEKFVGSAAADPKVGFTKNTTWQPTPENLDKLKKNLGDFIGQATGGPQKYTGKDMKTAHKGMNITPEQFQAIGGHLENALKDLKVGPVEIGELMKIVKDQMPGIVGQ